MAGNQSSAAIPAPPHLAVKDPVGANYEPERNPGMGQINADHWASGHDPTPNDRFRPAWSSYRHILVHYYTDIHLEDTSGARLTNGYRWNPLSIDWHTPDNQSPTMQHGGAYSVTVQVQNTSIYYWPVSGQASFALSYRWAKLGFEDEPSLNRALTTVKCPRATIPTPSPSPLTTCPTGGRAPTGSSLTC